MANFRAFAHGFVYMVAVLVTALALAGCTPSTDPPPNATTTPVWPSISSTS